MPPRGTGETRCMGEATKTGLTRDWLGTQCLRPRPPPRTPAPRKSGLHQHRLIYNPGRAALLASDRSNLRCAGRPHPPRARSEAPSGGAARRRPVPGDQAGAVAHLVSSQDTTGCGAASLTPRGPDHLVRTRPRGNRSAQPSRGELGSRGRRGWRRRPRRRPRALPEIHQWSLISASLRLLRSRAASTTPPSKTENADRKNQIRSAMTAPIAP